MKSYFLGPIANKPQARILLSKLMPNQNEPWVLLDTALDPIAYFNIIDTDEGPGIIADISGRHFNEDGKVIGLLQKIGLEIGGTINNDNGESIND